MHRTTPSRARPARTGAPPPSTRPPTAKTHSRIEVAWCTKNGTGTRLIPDGAITGAHFVQTPDFVQVTGVGNLTFLNIPAGDAGVRPSLSVSYLIPPHPHPGRGMHARTHASMHRRSPNKSPQLDPHGQDGNGNPIGGLVFSSAFGQLQEIFEWTNFVSDSQFCFRACKPGPMAPTWCQHIYDTLGCAWNMPANYDPGVFEQCKGDSGQPMGVYGGSTFFQGEPATPPAHPVPSSSSCTSTSTIANGLVAVSTSISVSTSASAGASARVSASAGASAGAGASVSPDPHTHTSHPSELTTQAGGTGATRSSTGASPTATGTNANAAISLRSRSGAHLILICVALGVAVCLVA
ncbi:hypothetical protein C0992_011568 [Termitomyces sp. T32_za158]|nr:hypothetical protein C0992_011568 [Termitomyces sp. T32_za158]